MKQLCNHLFFQDHIPLFSKRERVADLSASTQMQRKESAWNMKKWRVTLHASAKSGLTTAQNTHRPVQFIPTFNVDDQLKTHIYLIYLESQHSAQSQF